MGVRTKPGAFLRRGTAGLSPEALATLIKHPDELQALYDGLDDRNGQPFCGNWATPMPSRIGLRSRK